MCAVLLQSCLTLCGPMNYSPPGSSVHKILQARITGVRWHALLHPGIEATSPALQADSSLLSHWGSPEEASGSKFVISHCFWRFQFYLSFFYAKFCCCSVTQICPTLCNATDCSMPGFPALHYWRMVWVLPLFIQVSRCCVYVWGVYRSICTVPHSNVDGHHSIITFNNIPLLTRSTLCIGT